MGKLDNPPAAKIAAGTYTGDGAVNKVISGLGFAPKLVIVGCGDAITTQAVFGVLIDPVKNESLDTTGIGTYGAANKLTADGFEVAQVLNVNLRVYSYIAIAP